MTNFRQIIARFQGDENGTAFVEMAIVTPFVLLLSAGVFEFSNILNTRLLIEAGVEDAARYMARCSGTWDACTTLAKNLAVNGDVTVTGGSARVSGWTADLITIDKTSTAAVDKTTTPPTELYLSNKSTVDVAEVSTSYPYYPNHVLGLWGYLGFGNLNIVASHQERVFGW